MRHKFSALLVVFAIFGQAGLTSAFSQTAQESHLDVSSEPAGVLSAAAEQKLWTAYKRAGVCFGGETYDRGSGLSVDLLPKSAFQERPWVSPFTPVRGAAQCRVAPGNLVAPQPIRSVTLDERYGQQLTGVAAATSWFARLSTYARLTNDPVAKSILRNALMSWATAGAFRDAIHVSWGQRPVDWQVMTAILAVLSASAEVSGDLSAADRAILGPWLNGLVKQAAASAWLDREDNKAYMRAYIGLLWGLLAGDDKSIQNGISVYKLAIHDMRPDGSWPIDSQRSGMGLVYNAAATSYLVMIATALKQNRNVDLFGYQVQGRSIHTAVDFVAASIGDPSGVNQKYAIACPGGGDRWGSIAKPSLGFLDEAEYLRLYASLFPDRESAKVIDAAFSARGPIMSNWAGGSPACQFAAKEGTVDLAPLSEPAAPPILPAPKFEVATLERMTHDGAEINSLFASTISGGAKDRNKLDFNVVGFYSGANRNFETLRFVINEKLGPVAPKALAGCDARTTEYGDGQQRVIIDFTRDGENFHARNGPCIASALPPIPAFMATFLLASFRDVAIGLVKSGEVDNLKKPGLQEFFRRIAAGEITVGN